MNVQAAIEAKMSEALSLDYLHIDNESMQHNAAPDAETHFKVVAVAADFEGKSLVSRHQCIYQLLAQELANGVHALTLRLFSPAEWVDSDKTNA